MVTPRPVIEVGQAGGVGDLELGHPGELLDLDALERVDVGLAAGVSPVAIDRASWRAASQLTGPCCWNILARSPKIGMPLNGLSSPNGIVARAAGEAEVAHRDHGRRVRPRSAPVLGTGRDAGIDVGHGARPGIMAGMSETVVIAGAWPAGRRARRRPRRSGRRPGRSAEPRGRAA